MTSSEKQTGAPGESTPAGFDQIEENILAILQQIEPNPEVYFNVQFWKKTSKSASRSYIFGFYPKTIDGGHINQVINNTPWPELPEEFLIMLRKIVNDYKPASNVTTLVNGAQKYPSPDSYDVYEPDNRPPSHVQTDMDEEQYTSRCFSCRSAFERKNYGRA